MRTAIAVFMAAACIALAVYFHFILQVEVLYSHLFYIPVVLSALWWGRRGVSLALLLAAALLITHVLGIGTKDILNECVRAAMLVMTGIVVAELRRRLKKADLRQVEIALTESEERYRNLFEFSALPMAKVADDGRFLLVNRKLAELTGYSESNLVGGMAIADVHPEDVAPEIFEYHHARRKTQAPESYETRLIRKNGEIREVKINVGIIPGTDEDIAILEDITDRRQAEKALYESEEKYRTLVETLPQAVTIIQDGKVVFSNPAGLQMTGYYSVDEAAQDDLWSRVAKRERKRLALFLKAREKGESDVPDHYFTILQRASGEEFPVEVYIKGITYEGRSAQQIVAFDITEQKQAEKALRESEREKKLILDSIMEHVLFYDSDFIIQWANKAAADSLGLAPGDLTGKRCYELWHNRSEPCEDCPVTRALETGKGGRIEISTPDGKVWAVRGYPVKDDNGNIAGAVEFTVDITERKRIENALRAAQELYRTTIDATDDIVFLRDQEGRYVHVNEAPLRLIGIKREDIVGKTLSEMKKLPLENRQLYDEMFKRVIKTGKAISYDDTLVLPHRTMVTETRLWPVKDASGEVTHVAGFGRDLSRQRRALERLRKERDFNKKLIQASPAFFVAIDGEGSIVMMNNAMLAALGYASEEIIGKDYLAALAPKAEQDRIKSAFQTAKRGPISPAEEYRLLAKNGSELVVEWRGGPVFDEKGELEFIFGYGVDVTERKQAEGTLRRTQFRLATLLENLPDIVFYETGGGREYISENIHEFLGYSAEELTRDRSAFPKLIHSDDKPGVDENVRKWHESGEAEELCQEFRVKRADGQYVWLEDRMVQVKPEDAPKYMAGVMMDVTQRKRAEEELRRMATAVIHSNDAITFQNLDGTITGWNRAAERMYGYPAAEVVGKNMSEILPGRTKEDVEHFLRSEAGSEPVTHIETRRETKDGRLLDVMVTFSPVVVGEKVIGFTTIERDITERKRIERALRASEERYRTLIEQTQEPISLIQDFKHVYVNPAYCRLLGYASPKELLGKPLEETIAPLDREMVRERYEKRIAGEEVPSSYELRLVQKDGSVIWVEVAVLLREFKGRPAVQSASHDITKRKLAEEASRQSEERFRQVAENAQEWIWEVDAQGLYTYASPVVEKVLGYKPDEIVARKHFHDLFYPETRDEMKKAAFEVFREKQSFREFINLNVHKDGRPVWLSTSGVPLLDEEGNLIGYRGADTDITVRKRAEDALAESEEKYRALVDNVQDGLFIIQDETILFVNESCARMIGYTVDELIGVKFQDLVAPEDRELLVERYRKRQAGEDVPREYEFKLLHKDGKTRVFVNMQVGLVPYRGAVASMGTLKDVTERKRVELALRESEDRYRSLVELTQVPISVIQGFVHVYVNPAYCRMLGYDDPEELLGKPLEATIAPPDRDMVRERYRKRLAGIDVPSVYELHHLRKDGSIVRVEASVQLREFEGRPAVQAASRKITKREPKGGRR